MDNPKNKKLTQAERREKGLGYITDDAIIAEQIAVRKKLKALNALDSWDAPAIRKAIIELFGAAEEPFVNLPFICEYGRNIRVGKGFYANFGCTILDGAPVTIGDNVLFGPNVSLYTAGHPIDARTRGSMIEYCKPITIGNNVWLGGGVTVCPGVTIGDNCVIGAGAVVTRNIESGTVACGNPARPIRKITDKDFKKLFKEEEIDEELWEEFGRG